MKQLRLHGRKLYDKLSEWAKVRKAAKIAEAGETAGEIAEEAAKAGAEVAEDAAKAGGKGKVKIESSKTSRELKPVDANAYNSWIVRIQKGRKFYDYTINDFLKQNSLIQQVIILMK